MGRQIQLKTRPTTPLITLDKMRDYLRVDASDEDSLIEALIEAATTMAENYTGRAFISQTWVELHTPPPSEAFLLQRIPAIAIVTGKYINENDGSETVIEAANMHLIPEAASVKISSTGTSDAFGSTFLALEYTAGYGTTAVSVPPPIIEAVRQTVASLFEDRGSQGEMPPMARTLLGPFVLVNL